MDGTPRLGRSNHVQVRIQNLMKALLAIITGVIIIDIAFINNTMATITMTAIVTALITWFIKWAVK